MKNSFSKSSERTELTGLGVSSGVAIGHVRLFQVSSLDVGESVVHASNVENEVQRFEAALNKTRSQIEALGQRVQERGEDKSLIEVLSMHVMLLNDRMLVDRVKELIRENRYGAEYALSCVVRESELRYADLPDLFRERFKDVEDICRRVMNNLRGVTTQSLEDISEESVIVAKELAPSDTASMRSETVLGFVTEAGGKTSHTTILARALEIPAVVGVPDITRFVQENDLIIVDGGAGKIIISPNEDDLKAFHVRQDQFRVRQSSLLGIRNLPPVTLDGHVIDLAANIEFASEVETIDKYGAMGVGLFRTEYLFLNRVTIPTEEEQYENYLQVAETLAPHPVVIRTLDIGGDKFAHSLNTPNELNPYLGCRAIRFSLENRELFRTQLRAILRASVHKNLRVMYPLISGIGELTAANEVMDAVKDEMRAEGVPFDEDIPVGCMIEVPSAVMVSRELARILKFFSIGTNDLIQYTLAVDRGNEKISRLYEPLHPAVLRMIAMVAEAGDEEQIPVEVCGEMASDPICVLVLLALGIERFSMAPYAIPIVKEIVRSVKLVGLREFGRKVLAQNRGAHIKEMVIEALPILLPGRQDLVEQAYESSLLT
ncbi:MAG: phosphoenolpyruvate--protein phosphotransferase [Candidatus Hinthialibacter antarcticus]|nr:phosphoenolpyruvate--protein phosphotransferase [Candidatus Hinthialibacter antarcticus]